MSVWFKAWCVIITIELAVLAVSIVLFALLAGRDGPKCLRGVKRWIESHF